MGSGMWMGWDWDVSLKRTALLLFTYLLETHLGHEVMANLRYGGDS